MNNKLTIAAVLWLSGFVAGVVLVGRWRRMGGAELEVSTPTPASAATSSASTSKVQRTAQRVTGPIVAGAKADLLRLRNATSNVGQASSAMGNPDAATAT